MEIPTDVDHSAPVLTDLAIDIAAPRDAVWRLHTDINAWPTWQKRSPMPLCSSLSP